jgi:hypothetical protein
LFSGIYSRRIFENLGFTLQSEVAYIDFKDEIGLLYLKDTREHTSVTTWAKKL